MFSLPSLVPFFPPAACTPEVFGEEPGEEGKEREGPLASRGSGPSFFNILHALLQTDPNAAREGADGEWV